MKPCAACFIHQHFAPFSYLVRPAVVRRLLTLKKLRFVLLFFFGIGPAQVFAADFSDLLANSDFGRPDIPMTAAAISQNGNGNTARIEQVFSQSIDDFSVDPTGRGNLAQIFQDGSNNQASILQQGNLNRARIVQTGSENSAELSQSGSGNTFDLVQTGIGNNVLATQIGVANSIVLEQVGGNTANLTETGDHNSINVQQAVGGPPISINLNGNGLSVTIRQ